MGENTRPISPNQSYSILFYISTNEGLKSANRQLLINHETPHRGVIEFLSIKLDLMCSRYSISHSNKVGCKIRPLYVKLANPILEKSLKEQFTNKPLMSKFLSNKYMPYTMDLAFYGVVVNHGVIDKISFHYNVCKLIVTIIDQDEHQVDVFSMDDVYLFSFHDIKFENYFIRNVFNDNFSTYFKFSFNHECLLQESEVKVNYLTKHKKDLVKNDKIMTFDIETYISIDKRSIAYSCGFYDGENAYMYYISDFESSENMLLQCLQDMMQPKYKNYIVYTHNFAKFDIVFIFKLLFKYYNVDIMTKGNDIISLNVKTKGGTNKNNKIKLVFRDSLKLLPQSLESLAKSFNVPTTKGIFPYKFVTSETLNYVGPIPSFSYYKQDIATKTIYSEISKSCTNWSLRSETLAYLERDLISLHQILMVMSDDIFNKYCLDITKFVTLSSLSFNIFRSNFMSDSVRLPKLRGGINKAIREAFYGGCVDVYIPFIKKVFYYDVNSLYPFAMLRDMPIGQPIHSSIKDLNKIFGFVKATVTSPGLRIPILPCKVTLKTGDKFLIFPNGTWTAWELSAGESLKQAVNTYGYKVEIHESYNFERGKNIFKDYIQTIGWIKENSDGATRQIAKLNLNTLFGRLGLGDSPEAIKIVTKEVAKKIHLIYPVIDNYPIDDEYDYIRYSSIPDPDLCEQSGENYFEYLLKMDHSKGDVNSSPAISAAVTAYSRMIMNDYKNIYGINCAYTDTDSLVVDKPLNPNLIGTKLGQLKLEYPEIKEAIFNSPKLYF